MPKPVAPARTLSSFASVTTGRSFESMACSGLKEERIRSATRPPASAGRQDIYEQGEAQIALGQGAHRLSHTISFSILTGTSRIRFPVA